MGYGWLVEEYMVINMKIILKVASQMNKIRHDCRLFFRNMYSTLEFGPCFSENQVRILPKESTNRWTLSKYGLILKVNVWVFFLTNLALLNVTVKGMIILIL